MNKIEDIKIGNNINLFNGDCLEVMDILIEQGVVVDAIITDPPYGTTNCKWDSLIPLDKMWERLNKLIKPNGAIIFTASQPFTSTLVLSNIKDFKYSLVYEKTTPTGHLNAKIMPLRCHEDILIFGKGRIVYNPQKTTGHKRKVSSATSRAKSITRNNLKDKVYNNEIEDKVPNYDSTERYPRSVLKFSTDKQKSSVHPTQKPVELIKYLIKTYTNKGDIILDFTMGSGTTGVAVEELNRDEDYNLSFYGIELDEGYFNIAKERIEKVRGETI